MDQTRKKLVTQIFRLSNSIIFLEKISMLEHGPIKLYPSELHLLDVISQHRDINGSELAGRLGVSNGAVSQTLTRLEKRGVLYKTRDPRNKNELTVHFTPLGDEILVRRQEARAVIAERLTDCMDGLSDKDMAVISGFLDGLIGFFGSLK